MASLEPESTICFSFLFSLIAIDVFWIMSSIIAQLMRMLQTKMFFARKTSKYKTVFSVDYISTKAFYLIESFIIASKVSKLICNLADFACVLELCIKTI